MKYVHFTEVVAKLYEYAIEYQQSTIGFKPEPEIEIVGYDTFESRAHFNKVILDEKLNRHRMREDLSQSILYNRYESRSSCLNTDN
jgi:hypothetical protein